MAIEKYQSVQQYRCRMYLPENVESKCFLPDPSTLYHGYLAGFKRSPDQYTETALYNVLQVSCYPDPPHFHIARFKDWFRYVDPGLFQDGAVKETIKERMYYFLKDRQDILRSHCKQNHLSLSSFPPPVLTKAEQPKFIDVGPKDTWMDKADRCFRKKGFSVSLLMRVNFFAILLPFMLTSYLIAPSLKEQLALLLLVIVSWAIMEVLVRYFTYRSILRRSRHEPIIIPMHKVRLSWLLRELNDWRHLFVENMARELDIPELADAKTTVYRSRRHLDKNAYSIKILSQVYLKPRAFSFVRRQQMTLTIQIIGESIKAPPIVCIWFDPPKSITLTKLAARLINRERDELCRLLSCRLDLTTYHIAWPREKSATREEAKLLMQYWPVLQGNYHINTHNTSVAQLIPFRQRSGQN